MRGVLAAVCWGALFESLLLAWQVWTGPPVLTRAARAWRTAEVAGLAGAVGLLAAAAVSWIPWLRSRVEAGRAAAGAALGACAWLTVSLWLPPPDPDSVQFFVDPLTQRLPWIALATLLVAGAAWLALRRAWGRRGPPRLGWRIAATGAALLALLARGGAERAPDAPPDILLLSVDTLRADHLGCYGYAQDTSPHLDRLCASAVVFDEAMTPVPETIPSYTSVLTGLEPPEHGIFNNLSRAEDELLTLPERLHQRGYLTAAILQGTLPGTFSNLDQGFDLVVQRGVVGRTPVPSLADGVRSFFSAGLSAWNEFTRRDASATTDAAVRWLRDIAAGRPLFVHVYWPYPHGRYAPPSRYLREDEPVDGAAPEVAEAVRAYDGEIRFTDVQVGRVLEAFDRYRRPDGSWVAFIADHGEELGRVIPDLDEPYFGHSLLLYDSSLHVPLVVRPPGLAKPRRVREVVELPQLTATLLQAAGIEPPAELHPPLPLASSTRPPSGDEVFSVMRRDQHPKVEHAVDRVSVRTDEWRLVETRVPEYRLELLRVQDGVEVPVAAEDHPETVERLLSRLHDRFPLAEGALAEPQRQLSPREEQLLRQLGYIE